MRYAWVWSTTGWAEVVECLVRFSGVSGWTLVGRIKISKNEGLVWVFMAKVQSLMGKEKWKQEDDGKGWKLESESLLKEKLLWYHITRERWL